MEHKHPAVIFCAENVSVAARCSSVSECKEVELLHLIVFYSVIRKTFYRVFFYIKSDSFEGVAFEMASKHTIFFFSVVCA